MNLLYALTCETARTRDDGRTDVRGVFHQLFAPGFPAQQDHLALALVVEWEPEEAGRQTFRIDLVDPADSPVLTINGHTDVGTRGDREPPPQTHLVMPLRDVVFPQPGTYHFELHLGDHKHLLTRLHLIEHPDAA